MENQICLKKRCFPGDKRFRSIVSRIIEHDKGQGTIYKGTQGSFTNIVHMITSFWGPKRLIKANFPKKCCFHNDKSFCSIFSGNIERDEPQGTIYNGLQAILTITVEDIRAFL